MSYPVPKQTQDQNLLLVGGWIGSIAMDAQDIGSNVLGCVLDVMKLMDSRKFKNSLEEIEFFKKMSRECDAKDAVMYNHGWTALGFLQVVSMYATKGVEFAESCLSLVRYIRGEVPEFEKIFLLIKLLVEVIPQKCATKLRAIQEAEAQSG